MLEGIGSIATETGFGKSRIIHVTDDLALIEKCKKRDAIAQKALYQRYSSKMMALCFRYARDRMEAEDILQEGFIRVFDYIHQYENKGSFEGWMRRVMVTTAINHYRKHHQNHTDVDIEDAEGTPATGFDYYENKFELKELLEMVKSLPNAYKTVFNLYAIDGYSHREIGEMLGISEGGSKSNLSRARAMLQKMLRLKETYRYGTFEPNR